MTLSHTHFHIACAWLADALRDNENAIICECVKPYAGVQGAGTLDTRPFGYYSVQTVDEATHPHTRARAAGEDGCVNQDGAGDPAVSLNGRPIGSAARSVRVDLMTDTIYSSAWLRLRASMDSTCAPAPQCEPSEPASASDGASGKGEAYAARQLAMDASAVYSDTHAVPQLFASFCDAETGEPATLAEWRACTGGGRDDDLPSSMEWHPVTRVPGVLWHVCDTSTRMRTLLHAEAGVDALSGSDSAAAAAEGTASDPRLYVLAWLSAYLPKLGLRMQPAAYMRLRARLCA